MSSQRTMLKLASAGLQPELEVVALMTSLTLVMTAIASAYACVRSDSLYPDMSMVITRSSHDDPLRLCTACCMLRLPPPLDGDTGGSVGGNGRDGGGEDGVSSSGGAGAVGGVGGGVGGVGGVITAAMTSAPSPLNAVFMLAFAPVSTPVSPVNSATRTIASASSFTDA